MPGKELFTALNDEEYKAYLVKKDRRKKSKIKTLLKCQKYDGPPSLMSRQDEK